MHAGKAFGPGRALRLNRETTCSRQRCQTTVVDPGQGPLCEQPWAGPRVSLQRFPEVGSTFPAEEELRELGVELVGSVAFATGFTDRYGVV